MAFSYFNFPLFHLTRGNLVKWTLWRESKGARSELKNAHKSNHAEASVQADRFVSKISPETRRTIPTDDHRLGKPKTQNKQNRRKIRESTEIHVRSSTNSRPDLRPKSEDLRRDFVSLQSATMSWIRTAVNKAVEVGGRNNLTRTVRSYADSVVHQAGNAVTEGAKLLQDRIVTSLFYKFSCSV